MTRVFFLQVVEANSHFDTHEFRRRHYKFAPEKPKSNYLPEDVT